MKQPKIPREYITYFCMKKEIIVCDYLLNPRCPRTCNFALKYHPFERKAYLESIASESFQSQEDFDKTFLRVERNVENDSP